MEPVKAQTTAEKLQDVNEELNRTLWEAGKLHYNIKVSEQGIIDLHLKAKNLILDTNKLDAQLRVEQAQAAKEKADAKVDA
jgi:hypothetical protein